MKVVNIPTVGQVTAVPFCTAWLAVYVERQMFEIVDPEDDEPLSFVRADVKLDYPVC